jgi:hypothetical protein
MLTAVMAMQAVATSYAAEVVAMHEQLRLLADGFRQTEETVSAVKRALDEFGRAGLPATAAELKRILTDNALGPDRSANDLMSYIRCGLSKEQNIQMSTVLIAALQDHLDIGVTPQDLAAVFSNITDDTANRYSITADGEYVEMTNRRSGAKLSAADTAFNLNIFGGERLLLWLHKHVVIPDILNPIRNSSLTDIDQPVLALVPDDIRIVEGPDGYFSSMYVAYGTGRSATPVAVLLSREFPGVNRVAQVQAGQKLAIAPFSTLGVYKPGPDDTLTPTTNPEVLEAVQQLFDEQDHRPLGYDTGAGCLML